MQIGGGAQALGQLHLIAQVSRITVPLIDIRDSLGGARPLQGGAAPRHNRGHRGAPGSATEDDDLRFTKCCHARQGMGPRRREYALRQYERGVDRCDAHYRVEHHGRRRRRRRGIRICRNLDLRGCARSFPADTAGRRAHQERHARHLDRRGVRAKPDAAGHYWLGPAGLLGWPVHLGAGHADQTTHHPPVRHAVEQSRRTDARHGARGARHLAVVAGAWSIGLPR
ncbi:Uncharacterised protein [Mycobacteroides abscessus subsp. abscessus]|nr:Uncharacterised protein [Mycobacteroides abscessus subsp. abscessus]